MIALDTIKKKGIDAFYLLAWPVFFGWLLYGLHKRLVIAWKVGWIILAAWFLQILFSGLSSTLRLPGSGRWIATIGVILGAGLFIVICGRWWRQQRWYFGVLSNEGNIPYRKSTLPNFLIVFGIILVLIGVIIAIDGKFRVVSNGSRGKVIEHIMIRQSS
jgi:hypothetical protein